MQINFQKEARLTFNSHRAMHWDKQPNKRLSLPSYIQAVVLRQVKLMTQSLASRLEVTWRQTRFLWARTRVRTKFRKMRTLRFRRLSWILLWALYCHKDLWRLCQLRAKCQGMELRYWRLIKRLWTCQETHLLWIESLKSDHQPQACKQLR